MPKIAQQTIAAAFLLLGFIACAGATEAKIPLPINDMSDDPVKNFSLRKYGVPFSEVPAEREMQGYMLFGLIRDCPNLKVNLSAAQRFFKTAQMTKLSKAAREEVFQKVRSNFSTFTIENQVQLCAGANYLFGPKGLYFPNGVKVTGTMKPTGPKPAYLRFGEHFQ